MKFIKKYLLYFIACFIPDTLAFHITHGLPLVLGVIAYFLIVIPVNFLIYKLMIKDEGAL